MTNRQIGVLSLGSVCCFNTMAIPETIRGHARSTVGRSCDISTTPDRASRPTTVRASRRAGLLSPNSGLARYGLLSPVAVAVSELFVPPDTQCVARTVAPQAGQSSSARSFLGPVHPQIGH